MGNLLFRLFIELGLPLITIGLMWLSLGQYEEQPYIQIREKIISKIVPKLDVELSIDDRLIYETCAVALMLIWILVYFFLEYPHQRLAITSAVAIAMYIKIIVAIHTEEFIYNEDEDEIIL